MMLMPFLRLQSAATRNSTRTDESAVLHAHVRVHGITTEINSKNAEDHIVCTFINLMTHWSINKTNPSSTSDKIKIHRVMNYFYVTWGVNLLQFFPCFLTRGNSPKTDVCVPEFCLTICQGSGNRKKINYSSYLN